MTFRDSGAPAESPRRWAPLFLLSFGYGQYLEARKALFWGADSRGPSISINLRVPPKYYGLEPHYSFLSSWPWSWANSWSSQICIPSAHNWYSAALLCLFWCPPVHFFLAWGCGRNLNYCLAKPELCVQTHPIPSLPRPALNCISSPVWMLPPKGGAPW